MQQTPASEAEQLRAARSRLIRNARAARRLSQREAVALINDRLTAAGAATITRGHLANIEAGKRDLSEATLRAISAALNLPDGQLRNPLNELWAATA